MQESGQNCTYIHVQILDLFTFDQALKTCIGTTLLVFAYYSLQYNNCQIYNAFMKIYITLLFFILYNFMANHRQAA